MKIKQIGNEILGMDELHQAIYKSLGLKTRFNRNIDARHIKENIRDVELKYHPFWMVKTLLVAARPPFPPRKLPRMLFIDAVSGYRGMFSHVPPVSESNIETEKLVQPVIKDETETNRYIKDVHEKQINRSYILKKPEHEVLEKELVYLPIWTGTVQSDFVNITFHINANTGESEKFLADRWQNGKDLLT